MSSTSPATHPAAVVTTPSPSHSPSASVSPSPSASLPAAQVIGLGTLVLAGNGTAYDLDAVRTGWTPLANHAWVSQNIMYAPTGDNGSPIIDIAGSPYTDVVLSGSGPWTYEDCAKAPYGANPSIKGPNAVTGKSLKVGEGICVETQNTSAKSDGNHLILLVIKSITTTHVTVAVTVWAR